MRRVTKAVMNCSKTEFNAVHDLAVNVKAGITAHAATFPGTATALTALGNDLNLLTTLIGTSRGNSVVKDQRNAQAAIVFADLQTLLTIVNTVSAGNRTTIDLSGFPCSADPTPQAVPDKVIIKKIVAGTTALSAKIHIVSLRQARLTYMVRTTTVPGAGENDPSWRIVLRTTNSRKLIVPDLVHNQDVYISVCAENVRGAGIYSDPMAYNA